MTSFRQFENIKHYCASGLGLTEIRFPLNAFSSKCSRFEIAMLAVRASPIKRGKNRNKTESLQTRNSVLLNHMHISSLFQMFPIKYIFININLLNRTALFLGVQLCKCNLSYLQLTVLVTVIAFPICKVEAGNEFPSGRPRRIYDLLLICYLLD